MERSVVGGGRDEARDALRDAPRVSADANARDDEREKNKERSHAGRTRIGPQEAGLRATRPASEHAAVVANVRLTSTEVVEVDTY